MSEDASAPNGHNNGRATIAEVSKRVSDVRETVDNLDERFEKHRDWTVDQLGKMSRDLSDIKENVAVIAAVKAVEERLEGEVEIREVRREEVIHRSKTHFRDWIATIACVLSAVAVAASAYATFVVPHH